MFNVINMNGRVYDPQTAMFFSPDPFIQSGGDWKNYNRYSYCMNNPTRYTDPSGYKFEGNRLYNDWQRDSWGDYCQSAAGSAGRNSILNAREAHQKSSITYNYDNGKYEYVNGEEATFEDAIKMYVNRTNSYTFYGKNASTAFRSLRYGDSNTNRALNNIGISAKDAISALPSSLGIMVSLSQEFANANQGNIFITGMDGAETMMTTEQLIGGLELASKYSLIGGIGIEAILSLSGNVDARQNFGSDTMVSIALFTISAAGCGVPALILTVGWVMYRAHAFDGMEIPTIHYQPSNYNPNSMPQDAIRPQYPLKDGPQPIYFHY